MANTISDRGTDSGVAVTPEWQHWVAQNALLRRQTREHRAHDARAGLR